MIVAVKRTNYKKLMIKLAVGLFLVGMFLAYYDHLSDKFSNDIQQEQTQEQDGVSFSEQRAKQIERIIYDEAQIAVDLLSQEYVRTVKVIGRKLYIACDPEVNLDALKVRYGVMALIKVTTQDTKIAIDLKQIVESRYVQG
jgi:hypothetical protein